jgi:hypothetical protein
MELLKKCLLKTTGDPARFIFDVESTDGTWERRTSFCITNWWN